MPPTQSIVPELATTPAPSPALPQAESRLTGWSRYARAVGLVVLAGVTAYGLYQFATAEWSSVAAHWRSRLPVLPLVALLAFVDVLLEGVAWVWIVERFGLKSRDRRGVQAFLAGKAGMLMPAQLGRLIRPDAMARLGRGTVGECLKAEGAVFVLDSLAVVALLVALVGYRFHPALALPAVLVLVVAALFLGERVIRLIARTRFDLPRGFLWTWQSLAAVGVLMAGWAAHGLAFYVLVADLPGTFQIWDALVMAPASAVLGVGSGLPGGIGAIEGFLGYSLSSGGVPGGHMALAVAGFRLLTFWAWIVIGWVALGAIARRARRAAPAARAAG